MKYLSRSNIFTLILLFGLLFLSCDSKEKSEKTEKSDLENSVSESPNSNSLAIELIAQDSLTPLELLLKSHQVEYQSSIIGAFVTSIDAVENSHSGYWVYSVNDTTPIVASDKMTLKAGDRLKWYFQSTTIEPSSDSSSTE